MMSSNTSITSIHPEIIQTHILSRLDGQSLASFGSASSELQSISKDETLWTNICHSTWPSSSHPLMRQLISNFPHGARSFFSDSFSLLVTPPVSSQSQNHHLLEVISAVDIHYKGKLIFSKVHKTATHSRWFQCSPFRVDLIDPKNVVPVPKQLKEENCQTLMDDLNLSWIIVVGQKAANFSSFRPVSVQQYRLTGDTKVKFATILSVDEEVDVKCEITVTFEREMEVSEVSLHVENMDGLALNGKDSLEILQTAVENGERRVGRSSNEGRERNQEFVQKTMKRSGKMEVHISGNGWESDVLRVGAFGASILVPFGMLVLCGTCFC